MKQISVRLWALVLVLALVLGLTACGGEEEETEKDPGPSPLSGMVYVPEDVAWSSDLTNFYGGCASGEWVFLNGTHRTERGDTHTLRRLPLTGGEAEALPDYQLLEFETEVQVFPSIQNIRSGEDGTLWVQESYSSMNGSLGNVLRQLDETGKELYCFTTRGRSKDLGGGTVQSLAADGDGDVAVLTDKNIVLFSREGELLFSLDLEGGEYPSLVRLGDGRLGVNDSFRDVSGDYAYRLRTVDKSGKGWGETYTLPSMTFSVYDGNGDVLFYYNSGDALCAVRAGAEEPERIVDWLRAGIDGNWVRFFSFLPDGRLAAMWGTGFSSSSYTLSLLTPVAPDTLPEKTVLTYATMDMVTAERTAILEFNRTSQEYYIEATDYNPERTSAGRSAGRTLLATEIAAGKVPDIISIDALDGGQWGASGFLEDLWPYIDRDPDIRREDLMERVLEAYEEDGKLYSISDRFYIQTAAGKREVVGGSLTWTADEFWAALEKMPAGSVPMGINGSRDGVLWRLMSQNVDRFLDWDAGTCDFASQGFKDILSFCARFPGEPPVDRSQREEEMLQDGEQMLYTWSLTSLDSVKEVKRLLGGDITFVGYPNEEGRTGSAFHLLSRLAMSSASEHKDGVWSFLRTLLLPREDLNEDSRFYFPVNKADFEKIAGFVMTLDPDQAKLVEMGLVEPPVSQAEYDQLMELYSAIDSAYRDDSNILNIVTEQAGAYFAGDKSLEETVSLIQSRVSLYMGEQQ